jgi:hypothetical protein
MTHISRFDRCQLLLLPEAIDDYIGPNGPHLPRFRHRTEAIVEKFSDMQEDLERERKAMTRA